MRIMQVLNSTSGLLLKLEALGPIPNGTEAEFEQFRSPSHTWNAEGMSADGLQA